MPYRPRTCADKHERGVEDAELAGGGLEVLAHSGEVRKDPDDIGGVGRGPNGHGSAEAEKGGEGEVDGGGTHGDG